MFETLLEKLLSRIVGEYVEGISKKQMKVGIWSGNVDIKNLTIKKSVIQQLNIPFELKFGMIEQIKLKIPWTNLSSSSVEAELRGLYLLIVPKDKTTWSSIKNDFLQNKHALLMKYAKTLKDTIVERIKMKNSSKSQDKGYFGKLVEKIIDNLQIDIRDIHIRLESIASPIENASLGITLDSLNVITCDSDWKPSFVDRSSSSSSSNQDTVYKKMNIQNFYTYFNAEETNFISEKPEDDFYVLMKSLIYNEENKDKEDIKNLDFLLNFSTIGRLTQNRLTSELVKKHIPEFNIEIKLENCNFNLSKKQIKKLQAIINLANDYSMFFKKGEEKYQFYYFRPTKKIKDCKTEEERKRVKKEWWRYAIKYASSKLKKNKDRWVLLTTKMKNTYKEDFLDVYTRLFHEEDPYNLSILSSEESRNYENIVMSLDSRTVMGWIEEEMQKKQIEQEIKKEKDKKKGMFGGWFSSSNTDMINEEEQNKIEGFVKEVFDEGEEINIEIPENYPKIKFKFIQTKFKINLTRKDIFENKIENVSIHTKRLELDVFMKKAGTKIDSFLESFKVNYEKKNLGDEIIGQQEIIFCDTSSKESKFFKLKAEDHPEDLKGLDKRLLIELGSINFVYNKHMIDCLTDIFKFDQVNQDLTDRIKSKAKKQIRQAQDIGENVMKTFLKEQPKMLITIKMKTPHIIIPVDFDNNKSTPCWIFHPGNLEVKGDTFTESENEKKMYDLYSISLENIKMVYCQNIQIILDRNFHSSKMIEEGFKKDFFHIFKNFNINIDIQTLKKLFVDLNCIDARIKVNARLNKLELNFTPEILKDLKEITNLLIVKDLNYKLKEKKEILTNSQQSGYLNIKFDNFLSIYYCSLYKDVFYIYDDPKNEDSAKKAISIENYKFNFLNGSHIIEVFQNDKNILKIEFEDSKSYEIWKNSFVKRIDYLEKRKIELQLDSDDDVKTMASIEEQKETDNDNEIVNLEVLFNFEDLVVFIKSKELEYKLGTKNLNLNLKQTSSVLTTEIELQNFTLLSTENNESEYMITSFYEQSLSSKILKSNYIQKQEKLIIIKYTQILKDENSLKKADISFGSVFFDIEPIKLSKLMKLVLGENEKNNEGAKTKDVKDLNIKINEQIEISEKILEVFDDSEKKIDFPEKQPIEMKINLDIQAINVLLINQIGRVPIADLIIKDSSIKVDMRNGHMNVVTDFKDLVVYDLTNYPKTLIKRDIASINPKKIFGKLIEEDNKSEDVLIHCEFISKDPKLCNMKDNLIANHLNVSLQKVNIVFHMQVVMRILSFLTDQLLPALGNDEDLDGDNPEIVRRETLKRRFNLIAKRNAYIAIFKPFWSQMNVEINNIICNLNINQDEKIIAVLHNFTLKNKRSLNKKRLLEFPQDNFPYNINGIWNDNYYININGLDCIHSNKSVEKKLTSSFKMSLDVQLPLFDLEYDVLFNPLTISNYKNMHIKTKIIDTTHKKILTNRMYYDSGIIVDAVLHPFILSLGNKEYLSMMGALDSCVLYNDGAESYYIKDFVKKEELKKPMSLIVNLTLENIALVTLDNNKDDRVVAKVFIQNSRFEMVSHPTGDTYMDMVIKDLKGYHLLEKEGKFYEKGFINDLVINKTYEPSNNKELRDLFIEDLLNTEDYHFESDIMKEDKIKEMKKGFGFLMEGTPGKKNILLDIRGLKILLQMDVLLHLASLTSNDEKKPDIKENKNDINNINSDSQEEKGDLMVIKINVIDNFFLLPSPDFENCLVAKADINLDIRIHPDQESIGMDKNRFTTIQDQFKTRTKEEFHSQRDIKINKIKNEQEENNMKMEVIFKMKSMEIFLARYVDVLSPDLNKISKRQFLIPMDLDLEFYQMILFKNNENYILPDKITINKIMGTMNKFEMKFATKDINLLLKIVNYTLVQIPSDNTNEKKKIESEEKNIEIKENILAKSGEFTYNYIAFNIIEHILFTIVHEYDQIFAPTLMIKLRDFKILSDIEETIKAVIVFNTQIDYFNSDIFKWEPFLEKTVLRLEYSTIINEGVIGKNIKIVNTEQYPLNINVSIPFLNKIKFLMQTFDTLKEKNEEEKKKIKESINENFEKLRLENMDNKKGEVEEKLKTFISPIKIINRTGYTLDVRYYKKIIEITEDNLPHMINIKNEKIKIANNEDMPLNVEENVKDYDKYQSSFTQSFSYKFLSFEILHKEFNISKISGLNLEQNFSKKISLKGKQKNISQFTVLYNSRNKGDLKEIIITSSIKLKNKLNKVVTITIKHPFKKCVFKVKPGENCYIPFDLIGYLAYFTIDEEGYKFRHKKFHSLLLKDSGHFTHMHNKDQTYTFIMKIFRDPEFHYLTNLVMLPAILFKNFLPTPILLTIKNQREEREFTLSKQESITFSDIDISTIVSYKVKIPGFKESQYFSLLENGHLKYEKIIEIEDNDKRVGYFNLVRLREGYCHYNFAIYSDVVIINETNFDFDFQASEVGKKKKKRFVLAGNDPENEDVDYDNKIIYLSSKRAAIECKLRNHKHYNCEKYSNFVNTQGLVTGVFQMILNKKEDPGKQFFMEIGYNTKLIYIIPNEFIATKVIHLTPKTILYNKTKQDIRLSSQTSMKELLLKPEQKKPFFVYDYSGKTNKYLDIEVVEGNKVFKNLFPIDLNKAGSSMFLLLDQAKNIKIFRIEILIDLDYVVVNFLDRTGKQDLIFTNSTNNDVYLYQKDFEDNWKVMIKKGESLEFGFINPYATQLLIADFIDEQNEIFDFCNLKIEKLRQNRHRLKNKRTGGKLYIESQFYLKDQSRFLKIIEINEEAEKKIKRKESKTVAITDQRNSDFTNIDINIHQIGISLIAKYYNIIVEQFYFYLDDLRFVSILAEEQIELQLLINYINIDNNYSGLSKFPVLLTTSKSLKTLTKNKENFLNFHLLLNTDTSEHLKDIEIFELDIKPLAINTEYQLVNVLLSLNNQISDVFSSNKKSEYLEKYFKGKNTELTQSLIMFKKVHEWQILKFRSSNTWIYCKTFKLAPIKFILTFKMNQYTEQGNKEHSEDINVNLLVKTIGVTFLSIDESPITLTGLKLESVFESQEGFTNIILTHLKDQNRKNIAKIVGNLDIIGNPVSLFSNVGNGVVDFYEKPVVGFVKGPIEGFVGIGKGTSSLIKNTAAGAFNAVSKVTGSLASGLTSLSMDSAYLKQRNLDKAHKPKNLFHGMGKGVMSISKGFYSGITGVFSKPVSEIKKSGASGIFKGLVKGFGGLIVKPIGGIFDAVSQTTEGFKKTITIFDDKANEQKQRVPRVFYGSYRYFKIYSIEDANIMKTLKTIDKKKFENDIFLESIKIKSENVKNNFYIILTFEHLIVINSSMRKVVMYCEIKDISKLSCESPTSLTLKYFSNGNSCEFSIKNKESKILKLISSINYSRYIHYTSIAHH